MQGALFLLLSTSLFTSIMEYDSIFLPDNAALSGALHCRLFLYRSIVLCFNAHRWCVVPVDLQTDSSDWHHLFLYISHFICFNVFSQWLTAGNGGIVADFFFTLVICYVLISLVGWYSGLNRCASSRLFYILWCFFNLLTLRLSWEWNLHLSFLSSNESTLSK